MQTLACRDSHQSIPARRPLPLGMGRSAAILFLRNVIKPAVYETRRVSLCPNRFSGDVQYSREGDLLHASAKGGGGLCGLIEAAIAVWLICRGLARLCYGIADIIRAVNGESRRGANRTAGFHRPNRRG